MDGRSRSPRGTDDTLWGLKVCRIDQNTTVDVKLGLMISTQNPVYASTLARWDRGEPGFTGNLLVMPRACLSIPELWMLTPSYALEYSTFSYSKEICRTYGLTYKLNSQRGLQALGQSPTTATTGT